MIKQFQLLRNLSRFSNNSGTDETELADLSLIYGENGKGKSTLSAVIRSAQRNDSAPITSRRRLGSDAEPHVVLALNDGALLVFEDGSWSDDLPDAWVFDDSFVDENVYSGLKFDSGHRQGLHEIVVGRQGVELAREFDAQAARISRLNADIRTSKQNFAQSDLQCLEVMDFCALTLVDDIDDQLANARGKVEALTNASIIAETNNFEDFFLPTISLDEMTKVLGTKPKDINQIALESVRAHFQLLGNDAEKWIEQGMHFHSADETDHRCPFCTQDLDKSEIFESYVAYFGESYNSHLEDIREVKANIKSRLGEERLVATQNSIAAELQKYQTWIDYVELPQFAVDLENIARIWRKLRDFLLDLIDAKLAAPLREIVVNTDNEAVEEYERLRVELNEWTDRLAEYQETIRKLKEETAGANHATAVENLNRLKATKARFTEDYMARCDALYEALELKKAAAERKQEIRGELDEHRETTFPAYQQRINQLLSRFNTDFRIRRLTATNPGGYPSSTYHIQINDESVASSADNPNQPHFRTILSAGDRTTLAFSFFIAALDQEQDLSNHIVVIDDPVSSLDDNRMLATAEEIRRIQARAGQTIVLSHSKRFLCAVREHIGDLPITSLEARRDGSESTIVSWDIHDESFTQHDRRHERLREYLAYGGNLKNARNIAVDLRLLLEGYLRVACARDFAPGAMIGHLIEKARTELGGPDEIMTDLALSELEALKNYANRFHHHTNPAYDRALNDLKQGELEAYARRVLDFITPTRRE